MTRNQIIEELYKSKNFNDCLNKMEPAHLRDDLRQEIALIVCQWTDDKVVSLHTEGALEYYVVRVIINQIQSSSSEFFRKYRKQFFECYIDDDLSFGGEGKGNNTVLRHQINIHQQVNKIRAEEPDIEERLMREELEDYTIEQIDSLPITRSGYPYAAEMIRMYLKHGTYRGIMRETGIPYISCYKNIQQSLEILRQKALAPKPLFTKSELKYIQNGKNETET